MVARSDCQADRRSARVSAERVGYFLRLRWRSCAISLSSRTTRLRSKSTTGSAPRAGAAARGAADGDADAGGALKSGVCGADTLAGVGAGSGLSDFFGAEALRCSATGGEGA